MEYVTCMIWCRIPVMGDTPMSYQAFKFLQPVGPALHRFKCWQSACDRLRVIIHAVFPRLDVSLTIERILVQHFQPNSTLLRYLRLIAFTSATFRSSDPFRVSVASQTPFDYSYMRRNCARC